MKRELNKGVIALGDIFKKKGYSLYLVGGSVRNMVLGLPQGDLDVCSEAKPEEAAQFLKENSCTIIEKALSLGTIEVHLRMDGEKYIFEHTTLRQDYYTHGGEHRPYKVEFTDDIKKDARRRDFTVNALYLDLASGEMLDPTGHGTDDLENKVLRAAAEKAIDTLGDDGLRIMRMVRLYAELGFSIDAELLECAKQNTWLLDDISPERKKQELEKILLADTKYGIDKAHQKGLLLLCETGALKYVLPELELARGVEQSRQYHTHDVLGHAVYSCGAAPPRLTLRLAALLHDIGKPKAINTGGNMYNHAEYGAKIADKLLSDLRFDNNTRKTAVTLIENHMFDLEGKAKPNTIRKHAVSLGQEVFEMLIELRKADVIGSGKGAKNVKSAENWRKELSAMIEAGVPWSEKELEISGDDLMSEFGFEPSKQIGEILSELFWNCVYYPKNNKKDLLIHRARKILDKSY